MKKLSALLILISLAVVFIFSCQKDKAYEAGTSNNLRTTVAGIVLDESNAPLTGVTVTAYGQTTATNQYGTFVLKNINANKDRCVLEFSKTGFFKRAHGLIASGNTVNYVRIILISNTSTQNFSSSTGGTVSLTDGSSAEFQPNSFVTSNGTSYTGTVNIAIKHLSPDDANFGFTIPGGDLLGKNLNDEDVALYTYGMLGVELTGSSGEALQLAAGSSATLTFSIAASQLSSAPASIPLWYFDETTSLWKEEGTANKVGNNYVGTVVHFSWWNCDTADPSTLVKGRVIDCNGLAVPNVAVNVGVCSNFTNQNGEYKGYWVSNEGILQVQVLSIYNGGYISNSQPENIPNLIPGDTFIVPDLIIPCPARIKGSLKNCSSQWIDGFVSISNSTFYNFQYTTDGTFNLPSVPNTIILLYAINSSNNYCSQNITSLSAPNTLNVGSIMLCDTLGSTLNNSFILDGNSFSNQVFNINLTSSSALYTDTLLPGYFNINISMTGTAAPNFTITTYQISISDTLPSITTCGVYIIMTDGTNNYTVYASGLICNLTEVGMIGDKIKGTYYGGSNTNISVNNGGWVLGSISGSFDVIRTQ